MNRGHDYEDVLKRLIITVEMGNDFIPLENIGRYYSKYDGKDKGDYYDLEDSFIDCGDEAD
jgi:hypothetical protein